MVDKVPNDQMWPHCVCVSQVVIFNRGRVEQQGSPNDIIKNPKTPFIMKFVGDTNIVPASAQVGGRVPPNCVSAVQGPTAKR